MSSQFSTDAGGRLRVTPVRYLFIAFLFISSFISGQGIEPTSLQPTPYKNGILKGVIPFVDEFTGETYYIYQHVDSLVFIKDSIFVRNDSIFLRDGTGFVILKDTSATNELPSIYGSYLNVLPSTAGKKVGDYAYFANYGGKMWYWYIFNGFTWVPINSSQLESLEISVIESSDTSHTYDFSHRGEHSFIKMESDSNIIFEHYLNENEESVLKFKIADHIIQKDSIYKLNDTIRLRDGSGYIIVPPDSTDISAGLGIIVTENPANTYKVEADTSVLATVGDVAKKVGGTGVPTQVAFWGGVDSLSSSGNLYWDDVNGRLGIGTTSPSESIHTNGYIHTQAIKNNTNLNILHGSAWNDGSEVSIFNYSTNYVTFKPSGIIFNTFLGIGGASSNAQFPFRVKSVYSNIPGIHIARFDQENNKDVLVVGSDGRIGINGTGVFPQRNLDVNGDVRIRMLQTDIPTRIVGADSDGDLSEIGIGAGINIVSGNITNTGDADNNPSNELQDLSLSGNTLTLSSDATPVDLAPYLDNTDAQTLSIAGNVVSLTNGGSVTLPSAPTYTGGSGISVSGTVITNTGDADNNVSNELITAVNSTNYVGNTPVIQITEAGVTRVGSLPLFSSTTAAQGIVPGSSGATSNFLRGDGTWQPINTSQTRLNVGGVWYSGDLYLGSANAGTYPSWSQSGGTIYYNLPAGSSGQVLKHNGTGWTAGTDNGTYTEGNGINIINGGISNSKPYDYIQFGLNGSNWYQLPNKGVISLNEGSNISISQLNGTYTISATVADQSSSNELQSLSYGFKSGSDIPLDIGSGTGVYMREGAGITLGRTASNVMTIQAADNSNSNEIQSLSFTSPNLTISGGNTVALPVLPSGTTNQTLRHNGSAWVASSLLKNSDTRVDINSWAGTVNLGSKLLVNGYIQYNPTGFQATTLAGRDSDGGLTGVTVGSGLQLSSGTLSTTETIYGEMFVSATGTTSSTSATKISTFDYGITNGITYSAAQDRLTVNQAGTYNISITGSIWANEGSTQNGYIHVYKNGSPFYKYNIFDETITLIGGTAPLKTGADQHITWLNQNDYIECFVVASASGTGGVSYSNISLQMHKK